jgi:hypothetical protein
MARIIECAARTYGDSDTEEFVRALLQVLTEYSDWATVPLPGRGLIGTSSWTVGLISRGGTQPTFHSSGFQSQFVYGNGAANQVRHFIGWFVGGYAWADPLAQAALRALETGAVDYAQDVALGDAAIELGDQIETGELRPSQLGNEIRKRICQ